MVSFNRWSSRVAFTSGSQSAALPSKQIQTSFFRLYRLLYETGDIEVYVERMAKITIVSNVAGTETG
jgi:hypothetical protein